MMSEQTAGGRLVSRTEIAAMAGVRRSAVTNWQRRHPDFPRELQAGGKELFRLADIVRWLDARPVQNPARGAAEPAGVTYGDRVRASLGQYEGASAPGQAAQLAVPAPRIERGRSQSRQALAELLKRPMVREWGARSPATYIPLLMCLVFLRWGARGEWSDLERLVEARPRVNPGAFLREVGERTDRQLLEYGVTPAMRPALRELEPGRDADVSRLLALVAGLDREAFQDLLDVYADVVAMDSREAFTPRAVATLLSRVVVTADAAGWINDPYPRGGELLVAAVAAADVTPALAVSAGAPNEAMLRSTAMSLLLHGVAPQVDANAGAPWLAAGGQSETRADFVLANPPFNAASGRTGSGDWRYGPPPPFNDNFAWLQHVQSALRTDGRAGVIMADNAAVSDQPRERVIRQAMVEDGAVECVIALPPQLFTATAVSACVWILTPSSKRSEVHFINARGLGTMATRTRRELGPDDVRLVEEIYLSLRRGTPLPDDVRALGRSVSVAEIEARGYSVSPVDYVSVGTYGVATLSEVEASRHGLDEAEAMAGSFDRSARSLWGQAAAAGQLRKHPPSGWRSVLLEELCQVKAGPSPSMLNPKMYSEDGDVPVLLPKHLRNRRIHGVEDSRVSFDDARRLERFRVSEGDILCARTGTVGPVALVGAEEAGYLYNGNLLRLHDFECDVDPRFVLAYLSLPEVQAWIKDRAAMATVDSIKTSAMKQLPVSLPPFEEQRRIGELLNALDSQITAHHHVAVAAESARGELATLLIGGVAPSSTHWPVQGRSSRLDRPTAKESAGE
ncbi:N-6 DNA methylase [Kitasatospora sp. NPDC097691]|uniref:N-6 DNA methylase n=1 Tax=Kitasatospora sp. NPDC097691 TaxID=3157231 RepID=UPI0033262C73